MNRRREKLGTSSKRTEQFQFMYAEQDKNIIHDIDGADYQIFVCYAVTEEIEKKFDLGFINSRIYRLNRCGPYIFFLTAINLNPFPNISCN
jgi:hypothetical protein